MQSTQSILPHPVPQAPLPRTHSLPAALPTTHAEPHALPGTPQGAHVCTHSFTHTLVHYTHNHFQVKQSRKFPPNLNFMVGIKLQHEFWRGPAILKAEQRVMARGSEG
jgi:hypothetical protein